MYFFHLNYYYYTVCLFFSQSIYFLSDLTKLVGNLKFLLKMLKSISNMESICYTTLYIHSFYNWLFFVWFYLFFVLFLCFLYWWCKIKLDQNPFCEKSHYFKMKNSHRNYGQVLNNYYNRKAVWCMSSNINLCVYRHWNE